MATINRPTTKTVISTTQWGIPITDQTNQNTTDIGTLRANHVVAYIEKNITQTGIANSTLTPFPGVSLTFTPNATHNYRFTFQGSVNGTALGQWVLVQVKGGVVPDSHYFTTATMSAQYTWGHSANGAFFVGPAFQYQFPNSPQTLQMYGNGVGAGTTWGIAGFCFLACEDLGPF